jgi:hypothetical protein
MQGLLQELVKSGLIMRISPPVDLTPARCRAKNGNTNRKWREERFLRKKRSECLDKAGTGDHAAQPAVVSDRNGTDFLVNHQSDHVR